MSVNVRACDNCKRGKRKCDKQSPCNTCTKYKRTCVYSDEFTEYNTFKPNYQSIQSVRLGNYSEQVSSFKRTKLSQVNDERESKIHSINIYRDYCHDYIKTNSERNAFGPFSYVSIMKSDACLIHVWDYIDKVGMKHLFRPQEISYSIISSPPTSPASTRSSATESEVFDSFNSLDHQNLTGVVLCNESTGNDVSLSESNLLSILPTRKILWLLIKTFFARVYPYVPILDERDFRTEISRILDEESYENVPFLKITLANKFDFTYVGILLIILRLSYLSYFSNYLNLNDPLLIQDKSSKALERKIILQNPISLQFIQIAQKCLDEFNIFERTSVKVLQLAMLLRTYRHFAPEEGDGPDGGDSQVLTSTLVSMATNLGIHREPKDVNKRDEGLFRKLSVHLRQLDTSEFLCFGTPRSINKKYFDIRCPFYESDASNLIDIDLELEVIEAYEMSAIRFIQLGDLYDFIIDLNTSVSISQITEKLYYYSETLLPDLKTSNSLTGVANVCQTKSCLLGLQFIMSVQYIIFIHYERLELFTFSFKYIFEILTLVELHILPFIKTVNQKFDNSELMIVIPIIQTLYLKSSLVLCSILIRTNVSIQKAPKGSDRLKYLILLSISLRNACIELLRAFSNVSTRYYYFWRTNCGANGVLKICFTKEFYEPIKNDSRCGLNYSTSQVQSLLNIFYDTKNGDNGANVDKSRNLCVLQNIDINSIIEAPIPDISNDFISDTNLNQFWYNMKKKSRTNATMKKFPNSSIDLTPSDFTYEEPFNLESINAFYNEFYSDLFSSEIIG